MASKHFGMKRYSGPPHVDPQRAFVQNLAFCVSAYMQRYGVPPTVAHVSLCLTDVPGRIGPVRIEKAWGLYPHEMDLGVEA